MLPCNYCNTRLDIADEQCAAWTFSLNSFLDYRVVNFIFFLATHEATTFATTAKATTMTKISGTV